MDGTRYQLKLFIGDAPSGTDSGVGAASSHSFSVQWPTPDPAELANRELIRPFGPSPASRGIVPYTAAWYDELEQKRYQQHGAWLNTALEFGRHPGESLLLLGPGIGSDALRYTRTGTQVTIGLTHADYPEVVRQNLERHALPVQIENIIGHELPFMDGTFDIVMWNALFDDQPPEPARIRELFRVLKAGGKVIGLFPARYDAGYWQDLFLPLQWLYWHRPADPATGPKTSVSQLRRTFAGFESFKAAKRHLRRSELPHPWRILPLVVLQRFLGRVLVFKAFKPLSARTGFSLPLAA